MFASGLRRALPRRGASLILLLVLLLAWAPAARAQEPQPAAPAAPTLGIDDGALEVGVWWINDYENCGGWGLGDLAGEATDALGLRDRLVATYVFPPFFPYPTPVWLSRFAYGNAGAWEKDWKRPGAGGWDDSFIDTVDLAYFTGHGAASGFFFGVGGNTHNDCQVTKNDTLNSLGNLDLDWAGLETCNVLDDPLSNLVDWANSMYGLRLLMGYKTTSLDAPFGGSMGWNIRWGLTMTQAWFGATDATQPGWVIARILAERNDYFNDTWANHASFTEYDNWFHIWTHQSGTPLAATAAAARPPVAIAALHGEMPAVLTAPYSLAESLDNFAQVAAAFALTDTAPLTGVVAADLFGPLAGETPLLVSQDGSLVMDQAAGVYLYIEPDALWSPAAVAAAQARAAGAAAVEITPGAAIEIAQGFLAQHGLGKPDAVLQGAGADLLATVENPGRAAGVAAASARVVSEVTTNYKVNYGREIVLPLPGAGAASARAVAFPVVGPGAKLAVYVDATAPASGTVRAAAAWQDEMVLGGQGGWRRLQEPAAAGGAQVMVTMLPTTTVAALFAAAGPRVTLDYMAPPGVNEVIGFAPGYWEGPLGMNMDQLIPVYTLRVRNTPPAGEAQEYDANVPVNPAYMAPYAEILAPQAGTELAGAALTLEAADAAQTLAALGAGDAFDFVLGSGGPYAYEWFLNEAGGQSLGTGRTRTITLPQGAAGAKPGEVKIVLVVTDLGKAGEPRTASDVVTLATPTVFLPAVASDQ